MPDYNGLTKDDYDLLCNILDREYGVDLQGVSPTGLQTRISDYRARYGLASVTECIQHVRTHSHEADALGDVVYPWRTWFNRSPEHFEFLVRMVAQSRLETHKSAPPQIVIWSAACSTGQEAYTIAIYLMEHVFTKPEMWGSFQVIGSDCSQSCIRYAREGRYATADASKLAPIPYEKYFSPEHQDSVSVKRHVRDRISFTDLNLITSEYTFAQNPDFVFLRNALDHHKPPSRENVLKKVRRVLKEGGYLVFGQCPGIGPEDLRRCGYEPVAPECYRAVVS